MIVPERGCAYTPHPDHLTHPEMRASGVRLAVTTHLDKRPDRPDLPDGVLLARTSGADRVVETVLRPDEAEALAERLRLAADVVRDRDAGRPRELAPGLPKMLTTADVREALNVSINTLYKLVATGELPATKVGRDHRFWARDVVLMLERGRVQTAATA